MLMAAGCSEPTSSDSAQVTDSTSVDSVSLGKGNPDHPAQDSSGLAIGIKKDSHVVAPPPVQKQSRPKEKKEYIPYEPGKQDVRELLKQDSLQKAAKKSQKASDAMRKTTTPYTPGKDEVVPPKK